MWKCKLAGAIYIKIQTYFIRWSCFGDVRLSEFFIYSRTLTLPPHQRPPMAKIIFKKRDNFYGRFEYSAGQYRRRVCPLYNKLFTRLEVCLFYNGNSRRSQGCGLCGVINFSPMYSIRM